MKSAVAVLMLVVAGCGQSDAGLSSPGPENDAGGASGATGGGQMAIAPSLLPDAGPAGPAVGPEAGIQEPPPATPDASPTTRPDAGPLWTPPAGQLAWEVMGLPPVLCGAATVPPRKFVGSYDAATGTISLGPLVGSPAAPYYGSGPWANGATLTRDNRVGDPTSADCTWTQKETVKITLPGNGRVDMAVEEVTSNFSKGCPVNFRPCTSRWTQTAYLQR